MPLEVRPPSQRLAQARSPVRVGLPVTDPDRWMTTFAALEIKDEVHPLIAKEYARRLLGL